MKKSIILCAALSVVLSGCASNSSLPEFKNPSSPPALDSRTPATSDDGMYLGQQTGDKSENKLCDWVDKSDIIIKVNFADGVVKDTSYEVGFYFSPILSTMRLARAGCDYRAGFNYSEMKSTGAGRVGVAEVGVRGYSDNKRRHIQGEPISLVLDENGVPNIGSRIEVTITD